MNEVKSIPAEYEGVRFRSRLEARWAVYLDNVGIKWLYEYEGYQLPGGWYLPDFYLPQEKIWLEIKPSEPSEIEIQRARELAIHTVVGVVLFYGPIGSHRLMVFHTDGTVERYATSKMPNRNGNMSMAVRIAQRYSFWPVKDKDKVKDGPKRRYVPGPDEPKPRKRNYIPGADLEEPCAMSADDMGVIHEI